MNKPAVTLSRMREPLKKLMIAEYSDAASRLKRAFFCPAFFLDIGEELRAQQS
jgi:hypothetical protein